MTAGRVWVAVLDWGEGRYTSVHRTKPGAERRLSEKATALGIHLDLIDSGVDTKNTYGISYLEVER